MDPMKLHNVRDTLNPKVDGYSWKSLWINVDFPPPEGPDMTTGLLSTEVVSRLWR